ncbi:MAG TPA: ThuA domain-containing protein [Candidatus Limnocylindria bacterium]|jgi:trehalose utilization protein|nr:ThuA domain-containing protein [Candidatus Limnocylindria bacterium]
MTHSRPSVRSFAKFKWPIRWLVVTLGFSRLLAALAAPIRVVVWDEQQPQQKQAYTNFLGNQIAEHLRGQPGIVVLSKRLDDTDQGIGKDVLDNCDVLIWWGHVRNGEVKVEAAKEIVRRVKSGQLALISLHSAHWSAPFMEAMNERAREDALRPLSLSERATAFFHETNQYPVLRVPPKYSDRLTPAALYRKPLHGPVEIDLTLPNCCFPAYRADGRPSLVRTLLPGHPIARGLPKEFTLSQTEMYCEPFHAPAPDAVIFEERWEAGEWFRSGSLWNLGKGRVFYFRPGHETYPIYQNPNVLMIIDNAVRWLGHAKP